MEKLLDNQKSLMISSLDKEKRARISYSPYVFYKNKFYIYISKIAEHYNNIEENSQISIMLIEDEKDSSLIFARERASFLGQAKKIEDDKEILKKFSERYDEKIIKIISKLDFNLFEITVEEGRLVKGFGKAFDINLIEDKFLIREVKIDKGHKAM